MVPFFVWWGHWKGGLGGGGSSGVSTPKSKRVVQKIKNKPPSSDVMGTQQIATLFLDRHILFFCLPMRTVHSNTSFALKCVQWPASDSCSDKDCPSSQCLLSKVGQNHTFISIYGVYTVFLAGNHHTYGHIRCVYMVLANPTPFPHCPSPAFSCACLRFVQGPAFRWLQCCRSPPSSTLPSQPLLLQRARLRPAGPLHPQHLQQPGGAIMFVCLRL